MSNESGDLFANNSGYHNDFSPLAQRLRPKSFADFVGQAHILGPKSALRKSIENGDLHSMILWGPPGCGKTTLASMLAVSGDYKLVKLSAVVIGVKEVRAEIEAAKKRATLYGQKTILFLDEVHRFNKAQQDAFLPYIEDGTIIFIGATTENPSFSLNNALLSRARTYVFKPLDTEALRQLINKAQQALTISIDDDSADKLVQLADGDGRQLLNLIETTAAAQVASGETFTEALKQAIAHNLRRFDNKGDMFYDLISAIHKSIRGSNPHAAMYWFCRMIDGGCDLNYLARRLTVIASEDIGNADPRGLPLAIAGWQAFERIGSPEGHINLAQVVSYLACAPKSNASYKAYHAAMDDVRNNPSYPVPNHLVNAPTKLMQSLNKGKGYRYAHDEPNAYAAGETYFPEEMGERQYYHPNPRGLEIKIKEKLLQLKELDEATKGG
ncbi:MAG: recombination factor protein RarA [Gammaproteobacteria bacterium]|nr:MAG: recombination factor protein RarA [Gammaproteobacteria bacterium]